MRGQFDLFSGEHSSLSLEGIFMLLHIVDLILLLSREKIPTIFELLGSNIDNIFCLNLLPL